MWRSAVGEGNQRECSFQSSIDQKVIVIGVTGDDDDKNVSSVCSCVGEIQEIKEDI
jgi:hypothetical protein